MNKNELESKPVYPWVVKQTPAGEWVVDCAWCGRIVRHGPFKTKQEAQKRKREIENSDSTLSGMFPTWFGIEQ